MMAFRHGRSGARLVMAIAVALASGCTSDPQLAALDSGGSWCDSQYREYRDAAPAPGGMSDKDRGRYEDRARDYHVSAACQKAAERSIRIPVAGTPPIPGDAGAGGL
jgi:hypothetical protein